MVLRPLGARRHTDGDRRLLLVACLQGVFVSAFPILIVVVSIPEIARDFRTDEAVVAWALTAPLVASAVLLPTYGRLGDLYGHRRVFLVGFALSGAAAAASAAAPDPLTFVVCRTVSQTAGAATGPAAVALLISSYSARERPRVLALWASAMALAPALGLVVGGPAVDRFSWRGLFVLQAAVVALVLPLCLAGLPEVRQRAATGFDLRGGAAFMAASGALVFGLDRAGQWRWAHPAVLAAFAVVPVALAFFTAAERRARHPILPPPLVRERNYVSSCACEFLLQVATNGALFVAPLVLYETYTATVGGSALFLLPMPLGMAVAAPLGGRLAQRAGERTSALSGSLVLALALSAFAVADRAASIVLLLASWGGVGVANGLARPAIASAAASALHAGDYGAGIATMRMISTVGAAAGITLAVSVLPLGGSGPAIAVTAAVGALAAVLASFLRNTAEVARAEPPLAGDEPSVLQVGQAGGIV